MRFATNDQQRKMYGKEYAERFDMHRINSNHMYKIESIEAYYKEIKGGVICEFGAGTGIHAEYLLSRYKDEIAKYYFVDISENMIEVSKERLFEYKDIIDYHVLEAEEFTESIKEVDFLFCSGAMHHFQSPEKAIANFSRYVKSGGYVVICEPQVTCPYAFPRVIFQPNDYGQFRVRPRNVCNWLRENGFEVMGERYLHYRSNSRFFRFVKEFERIRALNFMAVMFVIIAKKQ